MNTDKTKEFLDQLAELFTVWKWLEDPANTKARVLVRKQLLETVCELADYHRRFDAAKAPSIPEPPAATPWAPPEVPRPILGQEAICHDGLGRVVEVKAGVAGGMQIRVQTYVNDRGCLWDARNVTLIPIPGAKP